MRRYTIRPADFVTVVSYFEAKELLRVIEKGGEEAEIRLDLGLRSGKVWIDGDAIIVEGVELTRDDLESMTEWKGAYGLTTGSIYKIEIRAEHYYKLLPVRPGEAPTIEIDGIRMHRTKWTDPWTDAGVKVGRVGVSGGDRVLDICTGLGYTALRAVERGADVISVEKDRNVLEIAGANPWSRGLERVNILLGPAEEVVPSLDDEFDAIVHDPPRLARAGELYSENFYRELLRLLRPGGRLVHYVGAPGSRYRGKDVLAGVSRRLTRVGFEVVDVDRKWGLITAEKPSARV
ncbi:methyltransferase domain-containing protein [Methanopyrus sp. KOL6]|uniref:class I SAM-dependent methyltransferase n=1 Tax=Methanopyrus sp. KOL6 TaxID=1937004 RepID=UPI000B4B7D64|nr:methyltransferase domain-containing protein [Methanopyrus sp. KOL6]